MTIQQWNRREELREDLSSIVMQMAALGRTAEGQNTSLFQRLDQQREEKTAELESLNALYNNPGERRELAWSRFTAENYGFLRAMRVILSVMLLFPLFWIMTGLHSGSAIGFWILTLLAGLLLVGWFSYLLHKYKSK